VGGDQVVQKQCGLHKAAGGVTRRRTGVLALERGQVGVLHIVDMTAQRVTTGMRLVELYSMAVRCREGHITF